MDVTLGAFERDAAIAGINVHATGDFVGSHRTIAGVYLEVAPQRLRFCGAVSCVYTQVCVLGHANRNSDIAMVAPPGKAPVTGDAGVDFDVIPILAGFDVQALVELIPVVVDHEFDLLAIPGGDADAVLILIHAHGGAAGDGVGFGPFFRFFPGVIRDHATIDPSRAADLVGAHAQE